MGTIRDRAKLIDSIIDVMDIDDGIWEKLAYMTIDQLMEMEKESSQIMDQGGFSGHGVSYCSYHKEDHKVWQFEKKRNGDLYKACKIAQDNSKMRYWKKRD